MILESLLSWFSVDMGIDLGTCNTLVCVRGEGIVLNEPSVVAVHKGTNRVMKAGNSEAVGWVAKEMLGKTPGVDHRHPPAQGRGDQRLRDHRGDARLLHPQGQRASSRSSSPAWSSPIPSGITAVEKRAVLDSAERAGARRVYLVEEPMAAGIGANLPIVEATASMIVDIGGGTTEVADHVPRRHQPVRVGPRRRRRHGRGDHQPHEERPTT